MMCPIYYLTAAILEECSFGFGYCDWTSVGENDKWMLSLNTTFIKYPGISESIDLILRLCLCEMFILAAVALTFTLKKSGGRNIVMKLFLNWINKFH